MVSRSRELGALDDSAHTARARVERCGGWLLIPTDSAYPERLTELRDPPGRLYGLGGLDAAQAPAVAIVGTRRATPYGLRVTRAIAAACARAGASVVSGLAAGIDGAAHEAALAAGGRTVAVLGTGFDTVYPRTHRALQERIAREGLLLSELAPGQAGHGGTFPRRNRIIAALADVTIVVEAGEGSGALITADVALDLGRRIGCVPNAIDVPSARGSNALLKAGAEPVLSPEDVLAMLALRAEPTPPPRLDGDAASCWDAICRGAMDMHTVTARSGLTARAVSVAMTALEVEGLLSVDAAGVIRPAVELSGSVGSG